MRPTNFIIRHTLALTLLFAAGCSAFGSGSRTGDERTDGLSESELAAEREARFGEGQIPTAEGDSGPFQNVPFEFDSALVDSAGRQAVELNAEILRENPNWRVVLEGHADERGTAEYNMALGENRARSVKDLLVSLGISPSRLETVSYGEEVPVDPGHNESAWAQNRRVHFSVSGGLR